METVILQQDQLQEAASLLIAGEVVAFPTETVYGLGALATSEEAVQKVYQAKQRPSDNPLIVHVSSLKEVEQYVTKIPLVARKLAETFWPGPLTIILEAVPNVFAPAVSAGLSTVAFRMPNHPVALSLIAQTGIPLVGPSANLSGRPSPTTAQHVFTDLNGKIAGICDGGSSTVGIESTVVDVTNPEQVVILRPGIVTKEQIEAVLDESLVVTCASDEKELTAPKSPGMKYRHYAPTAQVVALKANGTRWQATIDQYEQKGLKVGAMAHEELVTQLHLSADCRYAMGKEGDVEQMIHHLFAGLRSLDQQAVDIILVETVEPIGAGVAYMNRLNKAVSRI